MKNTLQRCIFILILIWIGNGAYAQNNKVNCKPEIEKDLAAFKIEKASVLEQTDLIIIKAFTTDDNSFVNLVQSKTDYGSTMSGMLNSYNPSFDQKSEKRTKNRMSRIKK